MENLITSLINIFIRSRTFDAYFVCKKTVTSPINVFMKSRTFDAYLKRNKAM